MAAFNHSLQECWYYNKKGVFQDGLGTVVSMKSDCEKLYEPEASIDPKILPRTIAAISVTVSMAQ